MASSIKVKDVSLDCNHIEVILSDNYFYCALPISCNYNQLANISIQFIGNETFIYPSSSYAIDKKLLLENGAQIEICAIALYGSPEERNEFYSLGSRFL